MKKLLLSMATVPLLISGLSVSASAEDGINILNDITVSGEIRPRYEYADVDNTKDAGQAATVRTSLTFTAGLLGIENLTASLGLTSVNNFGYENYNDSANGADYDTIADPQQAMLSTASLDYKIDKTALHAGRSHVNLDNQRFIGTVGWRQMDRSYDTVSVADNSVKNLNLLAAYLYGYAGVKSVTTTETASVLLNAKYKVMDELTLTAYDYMIASVSDTYGLALTGKADVGVKLDYRAEYAVQTDPSMEYRTQDVEADATYMNLDLGANISGILVGVNYEVQSGKTIANNDNKTQFKTTLGTNHKFNGWADMFLSTPTGGLIDANIRLGYTAKGLGKIIAVYHDFKADEKMASASGTSDDLGSEIDVMYVNKIPGFNNLKGLVKYAAYSAGEATGYTADKQVTWLMLDYKFSTK
ncbi:MAG: hypothetical protein ACJAWW_001257 [Sulfurimonas sp.]|jgi:hypothetical protein